MNIISKAFKSLVIIGSIYTIGVIFSFLFFSDAQRRFRIAEERQGQMLSQILFDILIFQDPNDDHAWMEKSVAFNKNGLYAEGFKLLNKAVEIDPERNLGYRGWLRLVKLKDYKGAIKDFTSLDSLTPGWIDYPWGENIHLLLAQCFDGIGDYPASIKQFENYHQSLPDSSYVDYRAFLYEGIVLNKTGDYKLALTCLNKALDIHPKSTETHFHKSVALKHLGQIELAKMSLKESLKLYDQGYKLKDIYDEVHNELYRSDIINEQNEYQQ